MSQQGLNSLLKWSVENSSTSTSATLPASAPATDSPLAPTSTTASSRPDPRLNQEALASLFGGPSDADLMIASMTAILSPDPEITLDDKLVAFDNFEQLIENLDNANNLEPLALWTPLLSCLSINESEIRRMAAWCIGTAVQNNEKSQERLLAMNGIPRLAEMAVSGEEEGVVKRKAVYALSSACRNYQPSMDVLVEELGKRGRDVGKVDAADMEAVDEIINGLRAEAESKKA